MAQKIAQLGIQDIPSTTTPACLDLKSNRESHHTQNDRRQESNSVCEFPRLAVRWELKWDEFWVAIVTEVVGLWKSADVPSHPASRTTLGVPCRNWPIKRKGFFAPVQRQRRGADGHIAAIVGNPIWFAEIEMPANESDPAPRGVSSEGYDMLVWGVPEKGRQRCGAGLGFQRAFLHPARQSLCPATKQRFWVCACVRQGPRQEYYNYIIIIHIICADDAREQGIWGTFLRHSTRNSTVKRGDKWERRTDRDRDISEDFKGTFNIFGG